MSKEQNIVSDEMDVQNVQDSSQEQDQYVARKAYEEVTTDMHKFKQRFKDAAAKLNEYEAKLKAIEEDKLKEQSRWQELYEKEKMERERAENVRRQERELYLQSVKLSALKNELGGKIRDEYLRLANIDQIEINEDGLLSSESILAVANQFRKEHPSLIPSNESAQITGQAPVGNSTSVYAANKSVNDMTLEEKIALLNSMTNKRS